MLCDGLGVPSYHVEGRWSRASKKTKEDVHLPTKLLRGSGHETLPACLRCPGCSPLQQRTLMAPAE